MVKWTKNLLPFFLQLLVFLRRESRAEKRKYLIREVEGVAGQIAQLPCDMTATKGDTVYLVLWFKEGQATPIYSYDVRELVNGEPKHWLDSDLLGSRAHFNARAPAHLLIRGVNVSDAGVYKCRVDFHRDATRNTRVNLTVVVPPTSLRLSDDRGETVQSYVGPYEEGKLLHLSCEAIGGYPTPQVKWLFNNELLDEHSEHRTSNVTRNNLSLTNLRRNHLKAQLTCIASNNRISSPLTASVTLDMNLRPLDVSIRHPDEPLSAERYYELECTSRGSRPPAVITWYNGSRRLAALSDTTSNDGNLTTSVVRLNFSASDNGQLLSCRAENHNIPTAVIEDTWKLNVQYKPTATVVLGSSLDPREIKEGDDVYFECQIKANPRAYKIIWKHNGEQLHHNVSAGMLITDPSLVLQSVTRQHAGRYVCEASNVEGDGKSSSYVLTIKFAPVCRTGDNHVYAIDKRKNAEVVCEVDANPEVVKYYWTFNNTAESIDVPDGRYTVESHKSVVTYTPTTDLDYGSLLCWGQNIVGRQKEPCVFQIVAATEPHPPTNCTVHSQSENSFSVSCVEGFHGGLNQTFYMEVYTSNPPELIDNVTSKDAKFRVKGLESGTEFQLSIFSANTKGRSAITQLVTVTAKLPVKQLETRSGKGETQEMHRLTLTPLLGVLMGIIVVIVIIVVVIVAIIKIRYTGRRNVNDPDAPARLTSSGGVTGEGHPCKGGIKMTSDITATEETDPDILQRKQSHEDQIALSTHLLRRGDSRKMESSGSLAGGVSTISVTGPRFTSASHPPQPPQPSNHLKQRLPPPPQGYGPQAIPSHPQCQTHAPYGTISGPGGMPIPPPPPLLHYFHEERMEDSPPPPPPPPCPDETPQVPLVYVSEGGHVRTGLSLQIPNTCGSNLNSGGGLSRIPEDPEIPLLSPSRRESAV